MPLTLMVSPAVAPVTVAEFKAHMRIDDDAEDALIGDLIAAATRRVEFECGLALITQQWRLLRDCWPRQGPLRIPLHPVRSVTALEVVVNGAAVAVDPAAYDLDLAARPARIVAKAGFSFPRPGVNAVRVTFTAGFGAIPDDVPEELRLAVKRLAAHWFEDREAYADCPGLPPSVAALLAPWRIPALVA